MLWPVAIGAGGWGRAPGPRGLAGTGAGLAVDIALRAQVYGGAVLPALRLYGGAVLPGRLGPVTPVAAPAANAADPVSCAVRGPRIVAAGGPVAAMSPPPVSTRPRR